MSMVWQKETAEGPRGRARKIVELVNRRAGMKLFGQEDSLPWVKAGPGSIGCGQRADRASTEDATKSACRQPGHATAQADVTEEYGGASEAHGRR